MPGEECQG